ncbi:hypothetical protein Y032_0018g3568 [Ancylostoma ceylanicum]|uniref:Receptor ligand binding region domain-containing protein n=1 Tax=Ancylostoma ceylanicum TaxID=53326 RepID=A0A016V4A9_9BILA|nr:hypothetical protein Y032_0018g3568 [Ancylostoma ceylanicum]
MSAKYFRSDVVAMIRDDGSYLPNLDQLARHLHLPTVNTFFTTKDQPLTTGTLPSMSSVLEAMVGLLEHTNSTCVSLLYDELYDDSARLLSELGVTRGVCLEQIVDLKRGSKSAMESALRRLLLTEARVVVVLLGEKNWIELMKALRTELVTPQKSPEQPQLLELAAKFTTLPFPQHWLKQFWATAFQCHIDGEATPGQQFSKECSYKQMLNVTAIAPDVDIAPISIAISAIAHATRKLIDSICPDFSPRFGSRAPYILLVAVIFGWLKAAPAGILDLEPRVSWRDASTPYSGALVRAFDKWERAPSFLAFLVFFTQFHLCL